MIVKVTEQDIENGIPESPEACPIARAIYRAGGKSPMVCAVNITIMVPALVGPMLWEDYVWPTPTVAIKFMADFDAGVPVSPFEFELKESDRKMAED